MSPSHVAPQYLPKQECLSAFSKLFIYIKIIMYLWLSKEKTKLLHLIFTKLKNPLYTFSLAAAAHNFPGETSLLLKGFTWKKIILASVPLAIHMSEGTWSALFGPTKIYHLLFSNMAHIPSGCSLNIRKSKCPWLLLILTTFL